MNASVSIRGRIHGKVHGSHMSAVLNVHTIVSYYSPSGRQTAGGKGRAADCHTST